MDNVQGWSKFVIPFIQSAWPKELRFHTESTSKAWLSLLEHTGEQFPIVLEAVKIFLREIKTPYLHLYYLHSPVGDVPALAEKFPKEVLGLLEIVLPSDPKALPYDLAQVLNLMEAVDPCVASDRRFQRLRELDISR
jgi:predicted metalloenzyme YecM